MAVPKRNDRLIQHFMKSQKADSTKAYSTSEESEFNALKYDLDHGMKLPEHKMNRYLELKQKLGKCKNLGLCPKALYLLIIN